ncbi:MAG TPA: hypothetical protein ENH89_15205 [Aurantimonas coralicida]|uniref:Uncharacterized protein n=1 Tax=Aurantimonas coralicida TaxID=182270 RepID=A0A9C9NHH2_9HYPH|nr:hypothetical protein [Aurantimonas coralicida]
MSSRRLGIGATTNDALSDQDIRNVEVPSIVNLWASSVTNGDQVGLRLDKTIIMDDGECNTIAGDILDTGMDQLVFNSVVGRGTLRVPIPVLTTELQFLISVEPII